MIVEDEALIAPELERIIVEAGHDVIGSFSTVEQALAYAKRVEVAFVDLSLSGGNSGDGLARRLTDRFGIKVVFVTGSPEGIGYGREGAVAVIAKPFSDQAIVEALVAAEQGFD